MQLLYIWEQTPMHCDMSTLTFAITIFRIGYPIFYFQKYFKMEVCVEVSFSFILNIWASV